MPSEWPPRGSSRLSVRYQLRVMRVLDEEEAEVFASWFYFEAGGSLGMSGALVWDTFREGGIKEIRDYCETDVLNTWLVFLRFEYLRGNLDDKGLEREFALVRRTLEELDQPHLNEFLAAWKG